MGWYFEIDVFSWLAFFAGAGFMYWLRGAAPGETRYIREQMGFYGHLYAATRALFQDYPEHQAKAAAAKISEFWDWWDAYTAGRIAGPQSDKKDTMQVGDVDDWDNVDPDREPGRRLVPPTPQEARDNLRKMGYK